MTIREEICMDIALMAPASGLHRAIEHPEDLTLKGDLGLTNFELVRIVAGLEKKYGVTIPRQTIESAVTVDGLVDFVAQKVGTRQ